MHTRSLFFALVLVAGAGGALTALPATSQAADDTTLEIAGISGAIKAQISGLTCNAGTGKFSAIVSDDKADADLFKGVVMGKIYPTITIDEGAPNHAAVHFVVSKAIISSLQQASAATSPQTTMQVTYESCKATYSAPAQH